MATALLKLAQGGPFGPAGEALIGATGSPVSVANSDDTGVVSWIIELVYVPPGSALVVGTLATATSGTPLANFTPDVTGPYRLKLSVYTGAALTGTLDVDIRNFIIREAKHGFIFPSYQKDPDSLPTLASGATGAKPNEMNVGGTELGWAGDGADGMLQDFIKQIDASNFDIVPDPPLAAGTVLGMTIDIPADAISVWYDAADDELWWADKGSPFMRRLDVSTGTPTQVAKFDLTASGVTMTRKIVTDATHAFAAHLDDAKVTIIEKSTNTVVGLLSAGTGRKARDVVVSGDDIYVSAKRTGGNTGEIRKYSKTSALAGYPTPEVAATTLVNPDGGAAQFEEIAVGGGKLWATSQADQKLHKINLTTLAHEGSQSVAKDTQGVIYAFGSVWVTTGSFADVLRFNPGTFPSAPIATIATGGFGTKGITADATRIFASDNFGANFVKRINPGTDSVDGTVAITGSLADMAVDTTYLWVTNQFSPNTGLHRVELTGFTNDLTFTGQLALDYGALAGDVSGDFRANTVGKLQGKLVSTLVPTDRGRALRYDPAGSTWWPAPHKDYIEIFSGTAFTSLVGYQAIGGFYFDPSLYHLGLLFPAFSTLAFEALLETTNVADSADLRLFNVTDAVVAGTLTSSSLVTAFVTTNLTLSTNIPLAGKVYELQLKMGAGVSPDLVTCRMARLSFNT